MFWNRRNSLENARRKDCFGSEWERERFIKTIRELKERAVIVEGKKDAIALRKLGLHKIIPLNNTPLARFAERIAESGEREVIILTDFDKEGRKLEGKLDTLLKSYKVKTNKRLRRVLMGFGRNCIEDFGNVTV
ncbi:MAG: hypothetical protein DRO99_04710 [Candidatus Aenigmatarchaeota archaeon]|nr:MAG: hypothetical protein DRO99_04710 [Candidatus Aenigmarchaeota archaeon]